ncbi:MAG: LPS assembly lipoprotein LptE [Steroidobacteraceae bacterium]
MVRLAKTLLLLSTMLLISCGWQLQGARRIPETLSPLYLDLTDTHSDFAQALRARLRRAGVNVSEQRGQAQAILRISTDTSGHHVSSVSALNEPVQYEVYYNIEYRLDRVALNGVGEAGNVLPPQALGQSTTMSYDKTLALAKQREELSLRERLADDLAAQVLRRIGLLSNESTVSINSQ